MSRIQGAKHVGAPGNQNTAVAANRETGAAQPTESPYRANNDSAHEKFNSREGIERTGRGHGRGHGLHGRRRGEEVDFEDENGNRQRGRILHDYGSYYEILDEGDGKVHRVDKDKGRSHGHRRATKADFVLAQQLQQQLQAQQQQQQEAKAQERREERRTEERRNETVTAERIKVNNRKQEARVVEQKKEARIDEAENLKRATTKKITINAVRQEHNASIAAVFQVDDPEMPHKSLSVSEIILTKQQSERLKRNS